MKKELTIIPQPKKDNYDEFMEFLKKQICIELRIPEKILNNFNHNDSLLWQLYKSRLMQRYDESDKNFIKRIKNQVKPK